MERWGAWVIGLQWYLFVLEEVCFLLDPAFPVIPLLIKVFSRKAVPAPVLMLTHVTKSSSYC